MRHLARLTLASLMLLAALACGDDRTERGLSPANEEAVPVSEKALRETQAERDADSE